MNKNYYEERVNRVLDYVTQHLDGDLSLLVNWLAQRQTDLNDVVLIGMSQDDPSITPAVKNLLGVCTT